MIYVPELNYSCFYVLDSNTIRAYKTMPTNISENEVEYKDFFINSHYLYREGKEVFTPISVIPQCLDHEKLTSDYYYRNDFFEILFVFLGFIGFCWFFISKLVKTLFRGFKRV